MTHKEFVNSIDEKTPEKILFQVPLDTLENKLSMVMFNAQARLILENSVLEGLYFDEKSLMLILRKGEKIFQIDMSKDFGVTLAEILPTDRLKKLIFGTQI